LRGQDIQAGESQDRLGLAYSQMAANQAQHQASLAAEQEAAKAARALQSQRESAMEQYRQAQLEEKRRMDALTERKDSEAQDLQKRTQSDALGFLNEINQPDRSKETDEFGLPVGGPMDEFALPTALPLPLTPAQALGKFPLAANTAIGRDELANSFRLQRLNANPLDSGPLNLRTLIGPDGQPVEGVGAIGGQGTGLHIVQTDKAKAERIKEAAKAAKLVEANDKKLLAAAIKERDSHPALSPQFAASQKVVDALQAKAQPGATSPEAKAAKANDIARQHPDWTRQQIIDAVNKGE